MEIKALDQFLLRLSSSRPQALFAAGFAPGRAPLAANPRRRPRRAGNYSRRYA